MTRTRTKPVRREANVPAARTAVARLVDCGPSRRRAGRGAAGRAGTGGGTGVGPEVGPRVGRGWAGAGGAAPGGGGPVGW